MLAERLRPWKGFRCPWLFSCLALRERESANFPYWRTRAKGKLPDAPLLARANGKAGNKESWKRRIAAAVVAAKLPSGTAACTLRHSTLTDLVNGRLPLRAVAQISNTRAEMIERQYGRLGRHAAAEALAGLAL